MTNSTPKTDTPALVHHPSAVLDDLCAYDRKHQAWLEFDQHLTGELVRLEAQNRSYWTPKAIRQSLGRK